MSIPQIQSGVSTNLWMGVVLLRNVVNEGTKVEKTGTILIHDQSKFEQSKKQITAALKITKLDNKTISKFIEIVIDTAHMPMKEAFPKAEKKSYEEKKSREEIV